MIKIFILLYYKTSINYNFVNQILQHLNFTILENITYLVNLKTILIIYLFNNFEIHRKGFIIILNIL